MTDASRLLSLPAELRCRIYDYVFEDIVAQHEVPQDQDLQTHDFPTNDFTGVTHLLLTCKLVHQEAQPLFYNQYICRLNLCFDSVRGLYEHWLSETARRRGTSKAGPARFTIYTRPPWQGTPWRKHEWKKHFQFMNLAGHVLKIVCGPSCIVGTAFRRGPGEYQCGGCDACATVVDQLGVCIITINPPQSKRGLRRRYMCVKSGGACYSEVTGRIDEPDWEAFRENAEMERYLMRRGNESAE